MADEKQEGILWKSAPMCPQCGRPLNVPGRESCGHAPKLEKLLKEQAERKG